MMFHSRGCGTCAKELDISSHQASLSVEVEDIIAHYIIFINFF